MEKCRESIGRLQHRCTTKNLPVCNDTIVVLKIILLHIISVITNFVIPNRKKKRSKNKQVQKHHTFPSTADARPTIPTTVAMLIKEVHAVFATP